jgi:hypothetical protein
MNRISRTAGTLVLTAALLSAAVPAAQARTLAKHQAPSVAAGWLDAALAWLGDLAAPHAAQAHQIPGVKSTTTVPVGEPDLTGIARTMCGSVIDPSGHCSGGGTGG